MKYDFGGYATKNDLRCSDGRVIAQNAFAHQDGARVPLVWQHQRSGVENILGHAILENRADGVYAYCTFNDTENGLLAKSLVEHGDIDSLSIFANELAQTRNRVSGSQTVSHGMIREVSLVVAGANPGARIDQVCIEHADGSMDELADEAVIYTGLQFEHGVERAESTPASKADDHSTPTEVEHAYGNQNGGADTSEKTVEDVFNSMTDEQKEVVYAMIGYALENAESDGEAEQDAFDDDNHLEHKEDTKMNVFEGTASGTQELTHAEQVEIFTDAKRLGSLKDAILEHGITNIDYLFPEARAVNATPEMIMRDQEWVAKVWNATRKSPFSRIKSTAANLTEAEARARGYIKGKKKVEEQFALLKRSTTPQTIYKKQALDRDDIIDITDFDVVAWLKAEMRLMLNEELARAILVGDGRAASSDDKINEQNIRPIYTDDEMYTIHYTVDQSQTDLTEKANAIIDAAHRARKDYKGSGAPTFYVDTDTLTTLLLARDKIGHRLYNTTAELASALRVKEIVEVPVMENLTRTVQGEGNTTKTLGLIGIIVNLTDYVVGADKGGAVSMFDDFDIDYNKEKYLIETRCSGALVRPYSAIVLEFEQAAG